MDLSRLSIDDYYRLMQMGRGFGVTDAYGADGTLGPVNATVKGVESPNANLVSGYIGGQLPEVPIRAGVAGTYYNTPNSQGYALVPNATANLGPFSFGAGASINQAGVMPTVNAGVKLPEDIRFDYSRSMPASGEASNNVTFSVPIKGMQFSAGIGKGDKSPGYTLLGGMTVDKLLGGQLDLQAQYDTQRKAAEFLARYAKQF